MKTTQKLTLKMMAFVISGLFIFSACKEKKGNTEGLKSTENNKIAVYKKTSNTCTCESDWFPHSQTPAPEEGVGSPFDVSSTTNCIFHQWSWQKFLWLTKPESNGNPLFLNELIQVNSNMEPVSEQSGATIVLEDTGQAGPGAILNTNLNYNSANNTTETVHYAIFIDSTLQKAANDFKEELINKTLPENNLETFPIGSLEVKSAWVNVNAIPSAEVNNFYTTTAALLQSDGTYKNTEVALLGLHVVGIVINHPEFIWATFEHNNVAPIYDWSSGTVSSDTEKLLFGKASASNIDGIVWDSTNKKPTTPDQAFTLFQFGIPRNTDNSFMSTSQSEPVNNDNIVALNTCVVSSLSSESDVWANYFYNGSQWINTDGTTPTEQAQLLVSLGDTISTATPGAYLRGSTSLANIAMETFTQTFKKSASDVNVNNLASCFSCHNAENFVGDDPKSPLYISHIFNGFVATNKGFTKEEIKTMKLNEFVEKFVKK